MTTLISYFHYDRDMFFLTENKELVHGAVNHSAMNDVPGSVSEALAMTDGEDYLSDVTEVEPLTSEEYTALMSWLLINEADSAYQYMTKLMLIENSYDDNDVSP